MLSATIMAGVEELRAVYGDATLVAAEGTKTFVHIKDMTLPPGCQPARNEFLLELDLNQPKPKHYVRPGQTCVNGQLPKNPTNEMVVGESWMSFSYNFPYTEGDSLVRFLAMLCQRFSKNE
ncbi:MAG: hypothetical protein M3167_00185 [Acidobacteriota bacterium]|nr:hypothetical protein [Acidobacteriota bacterium]